MEIKNELPGFSPARNEANNNSPENKNSPNNKTADNQTENFEKTSREVFLNFLVKNNFLTSQESVSLSKDKIDELIVRTAHEYEDISGEIPQENIDKARRILGLNPGFGESGIDGAKREKEIKALAREMKNYLEKFKAQCPEVLGMILCGSRMDPEKLPSANSDVDTVLVLKEGTITDPRTPEGEALLFRLRAFSDNTPTDSGFPVELDELYSTNDLSAVLENPTEKTKLTWGWKPNVVKYIGDNINGLDELEIKIKLLEGLNHPETIKLKNKKIKEAEELLARYLLKLK